MLRRARPSGWGCCEPRPMSRGYLLVRVDGKPYGLPLGRVLEVGDLGEVLDVPRALAAVRGVTPLRGRLVPLIHLGALLGERAPPPDRGRAAVLVELGAGEGVRQVALEVDDADEAPAPLPKAPDFLEGVLRYQGSAVPLVDLRKRLGAPAPHREETRTVILEWEGAKLGVVVDAVTEVLQVAASEVTAPPNIVKGLAAEYIAGIVVKDGRTVIALNTARLLNSKEQLAIEGVIKETAKV